MEADSTTLDTFKCSEGESLPFTPSSSNFQVYKELISNNGQKSLESQIVDKLLVFGLLSSNVKCPNDKKECKVIIKAARVIDRVQWFCETCKTRQPIRTGSFFMNLHCSLLQALQMMLAWCEDADCNTSADYFGVKPRVATQIFDKLDEWAIAEQQNLRLGGEDSVVLVELYPDCMNRLSPDTTDRPHVHPVLMLTDTKHIPTRYYLHVIKEDNKKLDNTLNQQVTEILSKHVESGSLVVSGSDLNVGVSWRSLAARANPDLQHFLSVRIWRGALTLCSASAAQCSAGEARAQCSQRAARYLHASAFRRAHAHLFPLLMRAQLR